MGRNNYSFTEFIGVSWALILTKLVYPQMRLIRRPVYMRGKNSLDGGRGLTTGHACRFDLVGDKKTLFIGNNCEIGDNVHIVAHKSVKIGHNVLMASKIFISDTNHGIYSGDNQDSPKTVPNSRSLTTAPVEIGNNVWIGENAVILPGSKIGDGCIVGANAVVNGLFEGGCMIAGVPAKIIKRWCPEREEWIKI